MKLNSVPLPVLKQLNALKQLESKRVAYCEALQYRRASIRHVPRVRSMTRRTYPLPQKNIPVYIRCSENHNNIILFSGHILLIRAQNIRKSAV